MRFVSGILSKHGVQPSTRIAQNQENGEVIKISKAKMSITGPTSL